MTKAPFALNLEFFSTQKITHIASSLFGHPHDPTTDCQTRLTSSVADLAANLIPSATCGDIRSSLHAALRVRDHHQARQVTDLWPLTLPLRQWAVHRVTSLLFGFAFSRAGLIAPVAPCEGHQPTFRCTLWARYPAFNNPATIWSYHRIRCVQST